MTSTRRILALCAATAALLLGLAAPAVAGSHSAASQQVDQPNDNWPMGS